MVRSPGVWGIEDDSGEDYFEEVYKNEEVDNLCQILRELGVTVTD